MKKLCVIGLIGMLMLSGCTAKDKSIILSEDTSNDTNLKYEVSVNNIKYETSKNQMGMPIFYDDDNDLYMFRLNGTFEEQGDIEMLKCSLDKVEKVRAIDESTTRKEEKSYDTRYYTADKENTGGIKVIRDWVTGKEYSYERENYYEVDSIFKPAGNMTYDYNFKFLINNDNFYLDSYIERVTSNESDPAKRVGKERVIRSKFTLCNFISGEKYEYDSGNQAEGTNAITKIDYSKKTQKFYGFNDLGEIYELSLEDGNIHSRLIYKISLEKDEFIQFGSGYPRDSIISGDKVIYQIYNEKYEDLSIEVEGSYQSFRIEKNINDSMILNLSNLELQDLGFKLSNFYANVLNSTSNLVLINTDYAEKNEYVVLDLSGEKSEIVYKFSIDKNKAISSMVSSAGGSKMAFNITEFKDIKESINPEIISSEVVELDIKKLF